MPKRPARTTAVRVPVEDLHVKDFMELFDIVPWPVEHDRIRRIFSGVGFVVLAVERAQSDDLWMARIGRLGDFHYGPGQLKAELRAALRSGGIRLDQHEPVTACSPHGVAVFFRHEGGEPGRGIQYATRRGNVVTNLHREYEVTTWE